MQDRFLAGIVNGFAQEQGLHDRSDSEVFERFVNHCVVSAQYPQDFDVEDVCPGGGQDTGLDGIAIIVNGRVVTSPEQLQEFAKLFPSLEVNLILTQAKTSPHFKVKEVGVFLDGVESFFSEKAHFSENSDIAELRGIKELVYRNAAKLRGRPKLRLYYASSGAWTNDRNVVDRVRVTTDRLTKTKLFDDVDFIPLDSERLRKMYAGISHRFETEIEFRSYVAMPEMKGVRQGFIGLLSCAEYLKLLSDDIGELRRNVFSDNVRDFQGDTPVNQEIHATVRTNQSYLPLLNNGVTLVARSVQQVGNKFSIQGYQVVNGCQTSYVLFLNKEIVSKDSVLPFRLIETSDPEVTNSVIRATNSQTEIKPEAFESIREFHKNLELFYGAMVHKSPVPLRYERRSKQYRWDGGVLPQNVVSLSSQLAAYLSVAFDEPHSVPRYYGELLGANSNRIFLNTDNLMSYYASALAVISADTAITRHLHRRYRYHLAMMVRASLGPLPRATDAHATSLHWDRVYDAIVGPGSRALFEKYRDLLREELGRLSEEDRREAFRRRDFTRTLLGRVLR